MGRYTNIQKAAILLLSMGPEQTVEVMKHLEEPEIEMITREITDLQRVTSYEKDKVMSEFHDLVVASRLVSHGGFDVAKDLLLRTFGEDKTEGILNRLGHNSSIEKPFRLLHRVEPLQILNLIQYENAQTIALVLSYLDSEKAATILSSFSPERQFEIAKRIAVMDTASPDVIHQVEQVLKEKLSMTNTHEHEVQNGIDSIVSILNRVDRGTEKNILETLQDAEPELADEIKQRMFVFDDIAILDNRSIQRILMDVDNQDLSLALRMSSEGVKGAIFRNISNRRLEALKEELASDVPARVKDVEDAQSRIVSIVRKLEKEDVIIISRSGEENLVI